MGTSWYNLVCGVCQQQESENDNCYDCGSDDSDVESIQSKECLKCNCHICSDCASSNDVCKICSLKTQLDKIHAAKMEINQIVKNYKKMKKDNIIEKLKSLSILE